jgi:hypothetical protein
MKSSLFEHYKKKYGSGGKLPVRKTGMWYQDGDVVVPSNEITMEGPNGEKDYFDSPILGIGLLSGDTQVMQPGENYLFPNDNAVLETKMQKGAQVPYKEMTPEQRSRFVEYMRSSTPYSLTTPDWLSLSSGATRFAKNQQRITPEEMINNAEDLSQRKDNAFKSGIDYSLDIPAGSFGQFSTSGHYSPFENNTMQDIYSGLTYSNSGEKGSFMLSPEKQQIKLRGKSGSVKYERKLSDDETISELAFNIDALPQYLTLYGSGKVSDQSFSPALDFTNPNIPDFIAEAGIRGRVGKFNYDLTGDYNPDTGYSYRGEGDVSLFKDKLNLSGRFAGNQEDGLQSLSAEARANLLKGLSITGGYRKSGEQPGQFNLGLSYNQAFQMGGMSIPGINGTVVSATTLQNEYKKRKKK